MNLLGISGSPRDKNTSYMIKTVLDATEQTYTFVSLKDKNVHPCNACGGCHKTKRCVVCDGMHYLYQKLSYIDAVVLGSPVYFDNVSGLMKNFMDRCLPLYLSDKLKGKKAALVSVGNYAGGELLKGNKNISQLVEEESVKKCISALENFCNHLGLKVVGSVYAVRSNPEEKEAELIELGKKLLE